ncbi:MAG: hypothetical protein OIF48_12255 [Silicimonas sp.]|nr:hypothetical protein [Silicimonas sp.]
MKDSDRRPAGQVPQRQTKNGNGDLCWKELLDGAIGGWTPADMALEQIIDRVESRS